MWATSKAYDALRDNAKSINCQSQGGGDNDTAGIVTHSSGSGSRASGEGDIELGANSSSFCNIMKGTFISE